MCHEECEGVSLNAKMTGYYRNSAVVRPPTDKVGKGHLQRSKAALRNETSQGGNSHYPLWEAQIFTRDVKTGMKPILRTGVRRR